MESTVLIARVPPDNRTPASALRLGEERALCSSSGWAYVA